MLAGKAHDGQHFVHADRLHGHVRCLVRELRAQDRRVPIEIVRQTVEHCGGTQHARGVGDHLRQCCCDSVLHGEDLIK